MVKPLEAKKVLSSVVGQCLHLVEHLKYHCEVPPIHNCKLLERFSEKQRKDIPANLLKNFSNPNTIYSGHKSKGYQVQAIDTNTGPDDKNLMFKTLNLITNVHVENPIRPMRRHLTGNLNSRA